MARVGPQRHRKKIKILLCYYDISCHNATQRVTVHEVLSVGEAS